MLRAYMCAYGYGVTVLQLKMSARAHAHAYQHGRLGSGAGFLALSKAVRDRDTRDVTLERKLEASPARRLQVERVILWALVALVALVHHVEI